MLKAAPSLQSSSLAGRPQLLCNVWPLRAARSAAAVAGRQFSQRAQQRLSSRGLIVAQANNDDEVFERMKREAEGGDIWGSEIVATVLKVGLVAAFVTAAVLLLDAAQPIVETTVERFPGYSQQ